MGFKHVAAKWWMEAILSHFEPPIYCNSQGASGELLSKLLVSPLITPTVVPYIIPYIYPPLRSLDYSSGGARFPPSNVYCKECCLLAVRGWRLGRLTGEKSTRSRKLLGIGPKHWGGRVGRTIKNLYLSWKLLLDKSVFAVYLGVLMEGKDYTVFAGRSRSLDLLYTQPLWYQLLGGKIDPRFRV